jgi:hypothetical protein
MNDKHNNHWQTIYIQYSRGAIFKIKSTRKRLHFHVSTDYTDKNMPIIDGRLSDVIYGSDETI